MKQIKIKLRKIHIKIKKTKIITKYKMLFNKKVILNKIMLVQHQRNLYVQILMKMIFVINRIFHNKLILIIIFNHLIKYKNMKMILINNKIKLNYKLIKSNIMKIQTIKIVFMFRNFSYSMMKLRRTIMKKQFVLLWIYEKSLIVFFLHILIFFYNL